MDIKFYNLSLCVESNRHRIFEVSCYSYCLEAKCLTADILDVGAARDLARGKFAGVFYLVSVADNATRILLCHTICVW